MKLENYLYKVIVPKYRYFDSAHKEDHVLMVMRDSAEMAKKLGLSEEIALTCGAFHDLGLSSGREGHELRSGKIVRSDRTLRLWFNEKEIEVIAQAVEDHRSTLIGRPRNVYGEIVSDVDRVVDPKIVIKRCYNFTRETYPEYTPEEIEERAWNYLRGKYGKGGRGRLWISGTRKEKELKELQRILDNRKLFNKYLERIYGNN